MPNSKMFSGAVSHVGFTVEFHRFFFSRVFLAFFVVFPQDIHRITFIMFKPFLEQVNGLEKAGTSFESWEPAESLLGVF